MADHTELIGRLTSLIAGHPHDDFAEVPKVTCAALIDALEAQAREIDIHRRNIERLDGIITQQAGDIDALLAEVERCKSSIATLMADAIDAEALRAALQEADTIMGHDDAETEWRDKWAHFWGAKGVAS